MRAPAGIGLIVAVSLALAACGGERYRPGRPVTVDWDLSESHTRAQVTWPKDQRDLYTAQLRPVRSARIRLPRGELIDIKGGLDDIGLYRLAQGPEPLPGPKGEILEAIEIYSDPLTVEDAYRRALHHADQFGLSRVPIRQWRERRERGVEGLTDRTATTFWDRRLGGENGPVPTVELLDSGDEARPWVVMISLYWEPPPGSLPSSRGSRRG